jgi:uroporphyrinogen decarboxylase
LGPVQGNLDPLLLVAGGAAMLAATRVIAAALAHGPFVFNLGHGIVPETPPEHVAELVAALRGL